MHWGNPLIEVMEDVESEETEVLVIGSGMAGICAAIQAARLGCRTILVEKDEVLGGNSSVNLGIHISGAHSFHPYAAETGIINEIEEEAARYGAKIRTHGYHYNIARQWDSLLKRMMDESGVRVCRRTYARRAIMDGNRIAGVLVDDLATYRTRIVEPSIAVIEASGDGHVAQTAGAEFRMGRESRDEFGERGAPEVADGITMGTSVTALVRKGSRPSKFTPPLGTPPFEVGYGYGREKVSKDCLRSHASWDPDDELCFLWHTETGGNQDTIEDDPEIYERLLLQLYSVWNHIKNEAHPVESENWELIWVSPKAGKRESRRFLGDYVLTQNDVESGVQFTDSVGYGGYGVDVHDPVGVQARVVFHSIPPLYGIPYRCLYSRNVENLLLAGRLMSVTHMALGTVRLQKTLATAGQAVGAAAFLCKKHDCTPRDIGNHIEELQQLLLRNDATILGVENRDPGDLARNAGASATSESLFECTRRDSMVPLDRDRGIMLWDWGRRIDAIELYMANHNPDPRSVELSLRHYPVDKKWKESKDGRKPPHIQGPSNRMEWGNDNRRSGFHEISCAKGMIEGNWEGWVRFDFGQGVELPERDETSDEERLLILLPGLDGISIGRKSGHEDFAVGCWADPGDDEFTTEQFLYLFRISPRPNYGDAANVVNGKNRRYSTNPVNMWISGRGESLPQSVTLDFGRMVSLSRVHLTFDSMYRTYRETPFNNEDLNVAGMVPREYEVELGSGGGMTRVVSERDNYRRFRIHEFPPTSARRLRLNIKSTNEEGWQARVYEIRAYGSKAATRKQYM